MAFDVDAWLKDFDGIPDERKAIIREEFGKPERVAVLEKNQLRQSDYSKKHDELKKAQDALQVANDKLNGEIAEWAQAKGKDDEAFKRATADIEKSQAQIAKLTARAQRLAAEAGLDPAKALEGLDDVVVPPQNTPPPAPAIDTSKFVGADQFGSMSEYLFNLSTEMPLLAQEHLDLTGERLNTKDLAAEIQQRARKKGANLDPRAVWEEKYGIGEKRAAKDKAAREQELKDAEQRGFQRARTEAALPVPPSNGVNSPVLRGVNGEARKSVMSREQPESGVRSAASALASGKYRQQPAGAS